MAICAQHGCPAIVPSGRCPEHSKAKRQHERRHYSGIPGVNYGRRWRKIRARYLAMHPFCAHCPKDSLVFAAEVDHIRPHEGNLELFLDESNFQGLCRKHHSEKTAREVGLGG